MKSSSKPGNNRFNGFRRFGKDFRRLADRSVWIKAGLLIGFSLFLTYASIAIINIPFVYGDENEFIVKPTAMKRWLNSHWAHNSLYDTSFIRKNFLIINTTNDQELVKTSHSTDTGVAITSRRKLARLLEKLNEIPNAYNFIICDVFFQDRSIDKSSDSDLRKAINGLQSKKKILFAMVYGGGYNRVADEVFENIDDDKVGAVNVEAISDFYLRQRVTYAQGTIKCLPELLYERVGDLKSRESGVHGLISVSGSGGGSLVYNSFIPEILFDRDDFDRYAAESVAQVDTSTVIIDLGRMLSDSAGLYFQATLQNATNKRNILIGGVTGEHPDKYQTFYGRLDGSIILLNTYYDLLLHQNKVYAIHIIISLLIFGFISFRMLFWKGGRPEKEPANLAAFIWEKMKKRMYYLLLVLLTLISYFLFHRTSNLILLIILIELLHAMVKLAKNYRIVRKQSMAEGTLDIANSAGKSNGPG